jgi:hypothetical protein
MPRKQKTVDRNAHRDAHHLMLVISGPSSRNERDICGWNKPAGANDYTVFFHSWQLQENSRPASESELQNRRVDWRYVLGHNENGTSSPSVGWISSSCRAPAKHGTCRHGRLISDRQTIEMVKARYTKINGSPPDEDTLKLERYRASQVRRCISRSTYRKHFYGPDVTWIVCTSVHTVLVRPRLK